MSQLTDQDSITIFDAFNALRKSPKYFIGWFLILMMLVAGTYFLLPRKYVSDGKFYVQVGRSSIGSIPSTTQGTVQLTDSRETEVKTVVDLLESRELAQRVADRIGVERILKPNSMVERTLENTLDSLTAFTDQFKSGAPDSSETDLTKEEIDTINRRNKAIKALMKNVSIDHEKKTTVVSVSFRAQTPFLSRDIVQAYLEEYKMAHVEVNQLEAEIGFFDEQFDEQEKKLSQAEQELEEFRSSLKTLSIGGARSLLQRKVDQLELERVNTIVEYSQANELAAQFQAQLSGMSEFIEGSDTSVSSLAADKGREALYNLQIQESEMAAILKDNNPKLQALRAAIKNAERELDSIPETFKETERTVSIAHQEVRVLMAQARARSGSLKKKLTQTEELLAIAREKVQNLNAAEVRSNKLVRNVNISQTILMELADKRAESETMLAQDAENISNVKIAQAASLIPKKAFPSGAVFLILGTAFSFTGATLMTMLRYFQIVNGNFQVRVPAAVARRRRNLRRAGRETHTDARRGDARRGDGGRSDEDVLDDEPFESGQEHDIVR